MLPFISSVRSLHLIWNLNPDRLLISVMFLRQEFFRVLLCCADWGSCYLNLAGITKFEYERKNEKVIVLKWHHRVNGLVNEHSYAANQNKDRSIHLLKILAVPIPTIKLSLWNQCLYYFQWVFCLGICNVNGLYFLTLKSQRPITVIFWAFLNLFSMAFEGLLICSTFHKTDLLTLTPHTPTPEPVRYDKKDGQWYTHDGVDVKDTQSRKGVFSTGNFQNYFSNFAS